MDEYRNQNDSDAIGLEIRGVSEYIEDLLSNFRSITTIALILMICIVLGLKLPFESVNWISNIVGFVNWWIFICMGTAAILLPVSLVIIYRTDIFFFFNYAGLLSRISLAVVILISFIPQVAPAIKAIGVVGLFIEVILYIAFGSLFIIPGEPFVRIFFKYHRKQVEMVARTGFGSNSSTGGTASGATSG